VSDTYPILDELGRTLGSLVRTLRECDLDATITRVDLMSEDEAKAVLVAAIVWIEHPPLKLVGQ
jgi:hypothetical protein